MNEVIFTYLCPLPGKVKGYTVLMDGFYTIVVNSNLSPEARMRAYRHEVKHLGKDDFHRDDPVGEIGKGM